MNKKFNRSFIALAAFTAAVVSQSSIASSVVDTARVISKTPITRQVPVSQEVCRDQRVTNQNSNSGSSPGVGTILGGVAGAAVGNQIGGGNGKTVATVLGALGGAMIGNNMESDSNNSEPQTRMVKNCQVVNSYENQTTGYHVVYEYGGKQYRTEMVNNPGRTIKLRLTPIDEAGSYSNDSYDRDEKREDRGNRKPYRNDDRYERQDGR